jgi:hypothetical protein
LPDLVGLRIGSSNMRARVSTLLPRVDLAALTDGLELTPSSLERLDFDLLRESAAAAFGLGDLRMRGHLHHQALRAAAHAAGHLSAERLATLLHTSASFIHRLRKEAPSASELRAITLQLSLRTAIVERTRNSDAAPTPKLTA